MADMNVLGTIDVAHELGLPEWRLNEAVRRGDVSPALVAGRRLWTANDIEALRESLLNRGVLSPERVRPSVER